MEKIKTLQTINSETKEALSKLPPFESIDWESIPSYTVEEIFQFGEEFAKKIK